jgi:hypothetical protein
MLITNRSHRRLMGRAWMWGALWAAVHLPGIAIAATLGGLWGGLAYALITCAACVTVGPSVWRGLADHPRAAQRWAIGLSLLTVLIIGGLTPHTPRIGGFGSDRNEAYSTANNPIPSAPVTADSLPRFPANCSLLRRSSRSLGMRRGSIQSRGASSCSFTVLGLTLPFWFVSPLFGPLTNPIPAAPAWLRLALAAGGGLLALYLGRAERTPARVLGEIALVQGLLVVAMSGINSWAEGRIHLGTLGYGVLAQGCGMLSIAWALAERNITGAAQPTDPTLKQGTAESSMAG